MKLTDFGLSRIGFLGRRAKGETFSRPPGVPQAMVPSVLTSPITPSTVGFPTPTLPVRSLTLQDSPAATPLLSPQPAANMPHFLSPSAKQLVLEAAADSPVDRSPLAVLSRRSSVVSTASSSHFGSFDRSVKKDDQSKTFVGTPDYLAPESILGIGQDASVDWVGLFDKPGGGPSFHLIVCVVGTRRDSL